MFAKDNLNLIIIHVQKYIRFNNNDIPSVNFLLQIMSNYCLIDQAPSSPIYQEKLANKAKNSSLPIHAIINYFRPDYRVKI